MASNATNDDDDPESVQRPIDNTWFSPPEEEGPGKEKGSSSPGCRIRGWKIKINISIFLGLGTDRPGCIKTVDYWRVVVGVQEKVTTLFWHFLRPTTVHVPGPVLRRGFVSLANQSSSKRWDGIQTLERYLTNQATVLLLLPKAEEWRVVVMVLLPPWQYQKRKSEVQFPRYQIICELCSSSPAKDDDIHFSRATNSSIFSCQCIGWCLLTRNAPLANPLLLRKGQFGGAAAFKFTFAHCTS